MGAHYAIMWENSAYNYWQYQNIIYIYWQYLQVLIIWYSGKIGTYGRWFCYKISMVSVMADGWCGNKKDVGETGGIWWRDKENIFNG